MTSFADTQIIQDQRQSWCKMARTYIPVTFLTIEQLTICFLNTKFNMSKDSKSRIAICSIEEM